MSDKVDDQLYLSFETTLNFLGAMVSLILEVQISVKVKLDLG